MSDFEKKVSRRSVLKGVAALAGATIGSTLLVGNAAANAPKSAMQYQDHPKNGEECSTCIQYIPGSSPDAMGACKLLKGSISPHGYCLAYSRN
ncbi:MAG TPA: high-potential iron-sulfur protein [Gammaproteobacteria bacterium]|nr:high-potential iron-sulfur protein [Gammaproteobacteria bacterium]